MNRHLVFLVEQVRAFETDFYGSLTHFHGLVDAFRHLHPEAVEHSWAGRLTSVITTTTPTPQPPLLDRVRSCQYLHESRHPTPAASALTDHSGLAVELTLSSTAPLTTSDPAD